MRENELLLKYLWFYLACAMNTICSHTNFAFIEASNSFYCVNLGLRKVQHVKMNICTCSLLSKLAENLHVPLNMHCLNSDIRTFGHSLPGAGLDKGKSELPAVSTFAFYGRFLTLLTYFESIFVLI